MQQALRMQCSESNADIQAYESLFGVDNTVKGADEHLAECKADIQAYESLFGADDTVKGADEHLAEFKCNTPPVENE